MKVSERAADMDHDGPPAGGQSDAEAAPFKNRESQLILDPGDAATYSRRVNAKPLRGLAEISGINRCRHVLQIDQFHRSARRLRLPLDGKLELPRPLEMS